jgi:hypothetical protein
MRSKSSSTLYPELRPAFHHKKSPREHSDEDPIPGSCGGEGYSSIHSDMPSSDEEEGFNREHDETWEVFDLRYASHHFLAVRKRRMLQFLM